MWGPAIFLKSCVKSLVTVFFEDQGPCYWNYQQLTPRRRTNYKPKAIDSEILKEGVGRGRGISSQEKPALMPQVACQCLI